MRFKSIPIGFLAVLDEEVVEELVHDVSRTKCTVREPAICKVCRREHDHYSADLVTLDRSVFCAQSPQITSLVDKPSHSQSVNSPLKRIITEAHLNRSVLVSTTDMYLASDIGAAVRRVYQSELDNLSQNRLRVVWRH